jgi:hypothetical protein
MIRNESLDWLLVVLAATLLFLSVLTRSEPEPRSDPHPAGDVVPMRATECPAVAGDDPVE